MKVSPDLLRRAGLLGAFMTLFTGCCIIFFPCKTPIIPPNPIRYLAPTSPENVIHNLSAVYVNRDVNQYDSTLAEGYVFRFLQADIEHGSPDSLQRTEEIQFAEHLFLTGVPSAQLPPASRIAMNVTPGTRGPDSRLGHYGWIKYAVNTQVALNFPDGNDLVLNSPAELYFKQQPEGSGQWRLAEWKDLITGGAPAALSLEMRRRHTGDVAMGPEAPFCKPMKPSVKPV